MQVAVTPLSGDRRCSLGGDRNKNSGTYPEKEIQKVSGNENPKNPTPHSHRTRTQPFPSTTVSDAASSPPFTSSFSGLLMFFSFLLQVSSFLLPNMLSISPPLFSFSFENLSFLESSNTSCKLHPDFVFRMVVRWDFASPDNYRIMFSRCLPVYNFRTIHE